MKKLIIMAAVIIAGVAANAASFKWNAGSIYGSDGATKWAGAVSLYAIINGETTLVDTATAATGNVINRTFSSESLAGGSYYDFFFAIEDNGKTFTSQTVNVLGQATSTATITFGNMATATQDASNWVVVPEPTSGLLLLLGMAGLALKRKKA